MKQFLIGAVLSGILLGCSKKGQLQDFTSDGCSLFPDQSLITEEDWCDCCFEHDLAYWRGGTREERLLADLALRECVIQKTGDEAFAELMFQGVRFGGSPYFYNWYRWGYGWGFEKKYQKLSDAEEKSVEEKLKEYFAETPQGYCEQ